jgi:hypothetical protein
MQIVTGMSQEDTDNLRKSFDFIIDIDAKVKLEHSIASAKAICNFLVDLGISPTIKFSGRRGVHIGIAANAFPESIDFKKLSSRYPEVPQTIASYIREMTSDQILDEMAAIEGGVAALMNSVGITPSNLTPDDYVAFSNRGTYLEKADTNYVYNIAELEKGWSNRHLFRMPYSLHPAYGYVSMPIRLEKLSSFKPEDAMPSKVKTDVPFLVNKDGEATELLLRALEWKSKQPKEFIPRAAQTPQKLSYDKPVPEDFFPPCIRLMLNGLSDGKKRSLFTLITYLRNMNWSQEDVEKRVREWNAKNPMPLPERFVNTQLKWHFRQNRMLMPGNCSVNLFYEDMGICKPDQLCGLLKNVKNPVNYPKRYMKKNARKLE